MTLLEWLQLLWDHRERVEDYDFCALKLASERLKHRALEVLESLPSPAREDWALVAELQELQLDIADDLMDFFNTQDPQWIRTALARAHRMHDLGSNLAA